MDLHVIMNALHLKFLERELIPKETMDEEARHCLPSAFFDTT